MGPVVIDVPVVVLGRGPGPLTAAKMLAGRGVPCLLAGHEPAGGDQPVALDEGAVAALRAHGLLGVLAPYLGTGPRPVIPPAVYEEVVKHHCVADVNVTVYDAVGVVDRRDTGAGVEAVLTDGRSRWRLRAARLVDGAGLPDRLPDAIQASASLVDALLAEVRGPAGERGGAGDARAWSARWGG